MSMIVSVLLTGGFVRLLYSSSKTIDNSNLVLLNHCTITNLWCFLGPTPLPLRCLRRFIRSRF